MQEKRSKAKIAEKRRDTTMTFRTQKMIASLTEVAARSQGISVSEYLERSTKASFDDAMVDQRDEGEPNTGKIEMSAGRPLSEVADELYDDDDVTCLFKRLYGHPWALNREQYQVLNLIRISPVLHPNDQAYNEQAIRKHWDVLNAVASGGTGIDSLPAELFDNADIAFALLSEAEQVAIYKQSPDEYFRRSKTHLTKARGK